MARLQRRSMLGGTAASRKQETSFCKGDPVLSIDNTEDNLIRRGPGGQVSGKECDKARSDARIFAKKLFAET